MDIVKTTVAELYSMPGFDTTVQEYATHAIAAMPPPKYLIEDYQPIEAAGLLHVYAVKINVHLVGFMSVLHTKIPHYGAQVAIVESIFVQKDFRCSGIGKMLLNQARALAHELQVKGLFVSCPWASRMELGKLLEHQGFTPETISYFYPI